MMNAEYFHPKTSPDVPVRVAVRMSMSIPGNVKRPENVCSLYQTFCNAILISSGIP
jgi:hypothetical protein